MSISFELAKRLKEAGLPQKSLGRFKMWIDPDGLVTDYTETQHLDAIYLPTLSELIEWCGEEFISVNRAFDDEGVAQWYAVSQKMTIPSDDKLGFSTPEEAVAELGIALHTK